MPLRWFVVPLLAGLAWGAGERQALERAIAEFAESLPAPAGVWTERTRPRLHVEHVQFLSPDVALVDAAWIVYGSLVLKHRTPVLLVLKKEAAGWRVAAYRRCQCPLWPVETPEPALFLRE